MIAIADTGVVIFEGSQTPKETNRIVFSEKVKSVFYNREYIGTVSDAVEEAGCNIIRAYDLSGKLVMEEISDMAYSNVQLLSSNEICISNRTVCDIYTIHGVFKFHHEFDEELYSVIAGGSALNYTFILNGVTEQVRLR